VQHHSIALVCCGFQKDHVTAVDEILHGLDDLVTSGKILYAGISNFPAWRAARAPTEAPTTEFAVTTSQERTMPIRKAEAEWKGNLVEGAGRLKVGSGAFEGPYSFKSRLEEGQSATNPEELIGAAHAGCFTMALTAQLSQKGITPNRIYTIAGLKLDKIGDAFAITRIELQTEAEISSIDDTTFQAIALDAKQNCPVSKALAGTEIHLTARLLNAR
jgi:osmotically inducible protein OsmC